MVSFLMIPQLIPNSKNGIRSENCVIAIKGKKPKRSMRVGRLNSQKVWQRIPQKKT